MEVSNMSVKEALKEFFGFDAFKGNQEQIIESLLNKQDSQFCWGKTELARVHY